MRGNHEATKDDFGMLFSVGPKKDTPRSDYRTDKHDISTMKQQVVAFVGLYVVVAERDEFWGGEQSKDYRSPVLHNPTWGRLFTCAKAAQRHTRDVHHAFFEGAYVRMNGTHPVTMEIDGQTVTVLDLSLGS
jgi:hypothetical protein